MKATRIFTRPVTARVALAVVALLTTPAISEVSANEHRKYQVPFSLGMGKKRFQELCSSCHGKWADGTKQGPPLVHKYYEPSHHGDRAFYRAIQSGTKQHHWSFGDMQPVPEATEKDATQIIQFLRWLQVQNGIR